MYMMYTYKQKTVHLILTHFLTATLHTNSNPDLNPNLQLKPHPDSVDEQRNKL